MKAMAIASDKQNSTAMVDDHPGHHNLLAAGVNRVEAQVETLNAALAGGATGKILAKKTAADYDFQWVDKPSDGSDGGDGSNGGNGESGGGLPDLTDAEVGDVLTVQSGGTTADWQRPTMTFTGTTPPDDLQGQDGDVYLEYTAPVI